MLARSLIWSVHPGAVRSARGYHPNVIDHYETPRNVGSLDTNDPNVGTGLVGAPACGDVLKLQIKVGANGRVEEAVFKARGAAWPDRLACVGCLLSLGVSALGRDPRSRRASTVCCTDVRVRLCDCELVVHDGVAQGEEPRRGRQDPELGHRAAPEAPSGEAALLHVRADAAGGCAIPPPTTPAPVR